MSPRFPSSVIDQMLTRGQITRVAPNRAQSDQLLTQAEAHLRSAQVLRDADTAGAFVLAYDAARKALTAILLRRIRNNSAYPSPERSVASAVDVAEALPAAERILEIAARMVEQMPVY